MTDIKLKAVGGIVYTAAEDDETKKMFFSRGLEGPNVPLSRQRLQALHLFRVTHPDGSDHYVLAESTAGAIAQSVPSGVDHIDSESFESSCIAKQVPFLIRGWGSDLF